MQKEIFDNDRYRISLHSSTPPQIRLYDIAESYATFLFRANRSGKTCEQSSNGRQLRPSCSQHPLRVNNVHIALQVYSEDHEAIRVLSKYEDEVLFVLSAILESGSVIQNTASFSEALYGLTRRTIRTTPPSRPSSLQLMLSFALIVPF